MNFSVDAILTPRVLLCPHTSTCACSSHGIHTPERREMGLPHAGFMFLSCSVHLAESPCVCGKCRRLLKPFLGSLTLLHPALGLVHGFWEMMGGGIMAHGIQLQSTICASCGCGGCVFDDAIAATHISKPRPLHKGWCLVMCTPCVSFGVLCVWQVMLALSWLRVCCCLSGLVPPVCRRAPTCVVGSSSAYCTWHAAGCSLHCTLLPPCVFHAPATWATGRPTMRQLLRPSHPHMCELSRDSCHIALLAQTV